MRYTSATDMMLKYTATPASRLCEICLLRRRQPEAAVRRCGPHAQTQAATSMLSRTIQTFMH